MAAASDWSDVLNVHPISAILRESNQKDPKRKTRSDSRGLIAVQGSDLYIWDSHTASCLYTNLRQLTADDSGAGDLARKSKRSQFQTLLCTNTPSFEVERLQFSPSGCHLSLAGPGGVIVLELPQRWGRFAEYEGGKDAVLCKTISVGERYFSNRKQMKLLKAEWHPGSANSNHITLLTSDNVLSTYNIIQPEQPIEIITLSDGDAGNVSRFQAVLGDVAVSFDFGQPVEMGKQKQTAWPVYILRGNGDVLMAYSNPMLYTSSLKPAKNKFPVQGPLRMFPPAEDNYGTDACSILSLNSDVPILVIATCSGTLHLCVLSPSKEDFDDLQSESYWRTPDSSVLSADVPEMTMCVYESVEIELSLTTMSMQTGEIIDDDFSCPIRLERDPGCSDRFYCTHAAGVHTVALPWITNIINYCSDDGTDEDLSSAQECVVEHLVCTKPLASSPSSPVGGVCVVSDHTPGPTLLVLTNEMEFIALPLSTKYRSAPTPLVSLSPSKTMKSPLRRLSKEPFEQHIRGLLKRQTSNPLLRSSHEADLSPQECFELLTRATQVFREEYIQKQDLVREEVEKRVNILKRQKEQQQKDLKILEQTKSSMRNMAENLAEKYEETQEKQDELLKRIDGVTRKLQSRLPVLSDAERELQKDLSKMKDNLRHMEAQLEQIRIKRQYQERQINQSRKAGSSSSVLNTNQSSQIKEVLNQQNEDICSLMKSVSELKLEVGT
ncbi:nucleoporin 88-like [Liolophura sinensis]|uniref:nucleoporin 88-like n=1 Tax=Liolophura sinensis TaxID=3198878 RepID=UPI00315979B2